MSGAYSKPPGQDWTRLRFDAASGRYYLGNWELHCGDCFQAWTGNRWMDTRIEHSAGAYYLVGLYQLTLDDLPARRYER